MIVFRGLFVVILTSSLLFSSDNNITSRKQRTEQALQLEIKMEEKFAREQKFYGLDEYDLKAKEIDPASLVDVPILEPDYTDNYGACDTN